MSTAKKLSGAALAAAAAGIFALAPISGAVAGESAKVQCFGVNGCKGMGSCKTAMNACKGHNSCKGKGFVELSADDCKEKGGSTSPMEKEVIL